MFGNSPNVISNQNDNHPLLQITVEKHLQNKFKSPISEVSKINFKEMLKNISSNSLIFDSGCGTGESSIHLAEQNPDSFVIGIDKSLMRISKAKALKCEKDISNVFFIRCDLVDFFQLSLREDMTPTKHFIFYPNPWPKKKHLLRRWHGHPIFPDMLKLCENLEVRSNWKLYLEEFAQATEIVSGKKPTVSDFNPTTSISNFEKKYIASQHKLYKLATF